MSKTKKVCSGCIKDFDNKDIYSAMVPNREYSTFYCHNCLIDLNIEEYTPFLKKRKKKEIIN